MSWEDRLQKDLEHFEHSHTKTLYDKTCKALGIVGWTITYIFVIYAQQFTSHSIIWGSVIAYNIVWEGLKIILWNKEDDVWITRLFGFGWFTLDLFIVSKFWSDGDGYILPIPVQQIRFIVLILCYLSVALVLNRYPSASRIWRHCSFTWGTCIQYGFIHYYSTVETYPYVGMILWSSSIGNFFYMESVRKLYHEWYLLPKHPIRFGIFLTQFIPSILISVYGIWFSMMML